MLIESFSPNTIKLVLRLTVVVDGDRTVLDQLLDEEIPQRDVLCAIGVGVISGKMKHRRVVDKQRNDAEPTLES